MVKIYKWNLDDYWKRDYCGLESNNNDYGIISLEELKSESQNTLSYGYCFFNNDDIDAIFNISIIVNNKQYSISYTPETTTHIFKASKAYGQINIDLGTLNSKINTLIEKIILKLKASY